MKKVKIDVYEPIELSEEDEAIFNKLSKQGPLGRRALTIFQYLFLRKEFKLFVKTSRKNLCIPEKGFDPNSKQDSKIFLDKSTFSGNEIKDSKLNVLKNMIKNNKLKIKIAIPSSEEVYGSFTEKTGIFRDENDDVVAFTGMVMFFQFSLVPPVPLTVRTCCPFQRTAIFW